MTRPRLSALDLAIVSGGKTSATALADTTTLAQRADTLGLTRFWVAEHHNMRTVASTTPSVLIAHLAARTDRIRVGSGGVMLPNHPPLVIAEQFAMLEALHPGRIDLGIGRAPGTDPATAAALRRSPSALGAEDFPLHLLDLMGLLGDVRTDRGLWSQFAATPASTSTPWIGLLGSSDYSAELAGYLGLPYSFAHHFDRGPLATTVRAYELYRAAFRPSAVLQAPYAIVSANVLVAATREEAEWFAAPARIVLLGRHHGRFEQMQPPDVAAANPLLEQALALPSNRIVGTPDAAVERLDELASLTQAAELMVSTVTYDIAERVASLELLANAWFG
ncbi:MAG TPA: LLM class flavin-dependent oxidoreductase [Acidimicrobiales bacterium]|nr:LLM class flavin-dependent oxidoreductase [Acidimicrobiales bacterium]